MNCLECDELLVQIPGKRTKQFCGSTCRSNYWQKKKREDAFKKKVEKSLKKVFDDPLNKKEMKAATDSLLETGYVKTSTELKKSGKIEIKNLSNTPTNERPENWTTLSRSEQLKWLKNNQ